jgi:hypothetical protein
MSLQALLGAGGLHDHSTRIFFLGGRYARRGFWAGWLCPFFLLLVGCQRGPVEGTIVGKVSVDGKPMSGTVSFVPDDGKGTTASAFVADGAFESVVQVGKKRVMFSAPKVIGKRKAYESPDSPVVDIVEELLPARYNVTSELFIDVQKGRQEVQYELSSTP